MTDARLNSAEIARDVEQHRDNLAASIDAISDRLRPGAIVDELISSAREGNGAKLLQNFGRDLRDNPVPLGLIGLGVAWAMLGTRRVVTTDSGARHQGADHPASYEDHPTRERVTAADTQVISSGLHHGMPDADAGASKGGASGLAERASAIGSKASDAVAGAASSVGHTIGKASAFAGDASQKVGRRATRTRHDLHDQAHAIAAGLPDLEQGSRAVRDFVRDQPLAAAAIGFGIGAGIAAMFRITDTERRIAGPTSQALKDQAREVIADRYEAAADTVRQVGQDAMNEAEAQGLAPDQLMAGAEDLAGRAQAVLTRADKSAREALKPAEPRDQLEPKNDVPTRRDTIDGEPV